MASLQIINFDKDNEKDIPKGTSLLIPKSSNEEILNKHQSLSNTTMQGLKI